MPLVKIDLYPGRSPRQKHEVAAAITQVFVEKLGSDLREVMVIFNDAPAHDWCTAEDTLQPQAQPGSD